MKNSWKNNKQKNTETNTRQWNTRELTRHNQEEATKVFLGATQQEWTISITRKIIRQQSTQPPGSFSALRPCWAATKAAPQTSCVPARRWLPRENIIHSSGHKFPPRPRDVWSGKVLEQEEENTSRKHDGDGGKGRWWKEAKVSSFQANNLSNSW